MQTMYESKQSVEITSGDGYNETVFSIGLKCTASSFAGSFDPRFGGEPPSGPEFEVTTIQVLAPRVNRGETARTLHSLMEMNWNQFVALLGEEIAEHLYEKAIEEAADSGEF